MKNQISTVGIAVAVSIGGFLFGFDAAVISGVVNFVRPEFGLNDIQVGWVVSAPTFSAMFAMLVAGIIGDKIGRKPVLIAVAFLYALSAIWSALAGSAGTLVIARMIGGLAFGAALILAPAYIAEISKAKTRGRLVSIQQLNIVLGFSVAYFSNYFFQQAVGSENITESNVWRWMLGVESIPAILYFFLLFFVPRSPRWLYINGRKDLAKAILVRLHGAENGEKEAAQIENSMSEKTEKVPLITLFKPSLRFILIIGLTLGVLQQITGINAIFFYATTIFAQSGVGTNAAFAQAVLVGIINVVFTLVAMGLIDRMGRKPLLLIGLAGIVISMSITSFGFKQASYKLETEKLSQIEGLDYEKLRELIGIEFSNDVKFKRSIKEKLGEEDFVKYEGAIVTESISMNAKLILGGILLFVASFALSLGPVMWVMLSEMYPNWIRGLAISTIGFVNSGTSWLVQFIFPWELGNFGNTITYLLYALFAAIGFVVLWRILPETKGKSLEELEAELVG